MKLFDYDKPGRGIDKNAPKKKGGALFFELVWRKLKLFSLSSMLYFAVALPVMLIYFFMFYSMLSASYSAADTGAYLDMIFLLTITFVILWGCGPASCGHTYLLRSFAREEHVWLTSDFFDKIKSNFKYGITILIVDLIFMYSMITAVLTYSSMLSAGKPYAVLLIGAVAIFTVIYTFMHYYMYQFSVTFKQGVFAMFKNSLIMAFAELPMNILMTLLVFAGIYIICSLFLMPAVIIIMFVFGLSFLRFAVDFYVSRKLKKLFIDPIRKEEN